MAENLRRIIDQIDAAGYSKGADALRYISLGLLAEGLIPDKIEPKSGRAGKKPEKSDLDQQTVLLLESCRVGAFVSLDKLTAIFNMEPTLIKRKELAEIIREIKTNGDDSVYHLCLSRKINRALRFIKCYKISELRKPEVFGNFADQNNIGDIRRAAVLNAIKKYDELVKQSKMV